MINLKEKDKEDLVKWMHVLVDLYSGIVRIRDDWDDRSKGYTLLVWKYLCKDYGENKNVEGSWRLKEGNRNVEDFDRSERERQRGS